MVSLERFHVRATSIFLGLACVCMVWPPALFGQQPVILRGHTDAVYDVEFSPNGDRLATGSYDNTIKIWRVAEGTVISTLTGHTDQVFRIAFSPSGSKLVSCSGDGSVIQWDLATGNLDRVLRGHGDPILDAAFFPNGKLLVTVGSHVQLWQGEKAIWSTPHSELYFSVAVSPNGKQFCGGTKNEIHVFEQNDPQPVKTFTAGSGMIYQLEYSSDGSLFAAACSDGTLTLWNTQTFEKVGVVKADQFSLFTLRFSRDGSSLLTAGRERVIRKWSVPDLALRSEQFGPQETILSVNQTENGEVLVCGSYDGLVHLWKVIQ